MVGRKVAESSREWGLSSLGIFLLALTPATAIALGTTHQTLTDMWDHGHTWWRMFAWYLTGWGFWAACAPLLVSYGGRLFGRRPWWSGMPAAAGLAATLFAAHLVLAALVAAVVQPYVPIGTFTFGEFLMSHSGRWLYINGVAVVGLLGVGQLIAGYHHARRHELQESQLETELARAQLEALRLQIEPHFLFNTLNSIASLIQRGDDTRALDMLQELSALLRDTVERAGRNLVTLRGELEFVERYLALQRARFADRLEVRYEVSSECLEVNVPTLLVQTLVENSIRHGLRRSKAVQVDIFASIEGQELRLEIRDNGPGLPLGFDLEGDAGTGLRNISSRLQRLYDGQAELELLLREAGGTTSRVRLPVSELAPPSPIGAVA